MLHIVLWLLKWYLVLAITPGLVLSFVPGTTGKIGDMMLRWHRGLWMAIGTQLLMLPVGTVLACIAKPTMMRDETGVTGRDGPSCLPKWADWWANTPDDPTGQQGDYETQVATVQMYATNGLCIVAGWLRKAGEFLNWGPVVEAADWLSNCNFGWRVKTFYWLAIRNVCYGLFWRLAEKTDDHTVFHQRGAPYPRVSPFQGGLYWAWCETSSGRIYVELTVVWSYSPTKAGEYRWGWKVQTLIGAPGPLAWLWQPKVLPLSK